MRKILTISIAAYNVEAYIRRALDSLIDDRVIDDLEIFVIDDGGQDGTLKIAEEYAEKYPDSIFPIHKENGGYGTTVNYGVDHATGKYFKLMDGDDWFDKEGLYQLVSKLKETDADMVVTPFCKVDGTNVVQNIRFDVKCGEKIDFGKLEIDPALIFGMHAITYKTKIAQESMPSLPQKCLHTDIIFATAPVQKCNTVLFLDFNVYMYFVGRDGQSVERNSRIKHKGDYERVAIIVSELYERIKKENGDNLQYIKYRAALACVGATVSILISPVNKDSLWELKEFDRKVKEVSEAVFHAETQLGKTGKLMGLLRKTGYMPYWLLKLVPGGFPYNP